ncbi:MAG: cyclic nucleotide-binding domain-containing protein, partial [Acetatifactor sp.]|nr:cyclic nucleotide-binding domain-containing protein [Acetatifactor sp.]
IYTHVLQKSLTDATPLPLPVRMFLSFGYVDEELAGTANSVYLCKLINEPDKETGDGVYTFYDWIKNIYEGKKQPSRNEFGEDYVDYLHKQKASGKLSEQELRDLTDNPMRKVEFELRNLFPTVNKITYGRVTTFCPIFAADNILKDLSSCHVTAAAIRSVLDKIRSIDYSAFYRETLNMDSPVAQKETIHVECLPDIILMPNAGIRGVTWQEIEGRKRTTPARMMLSIFHMEDLFTTTIRLVGDYRWEMCKRVQGARWNDLSERSLTSEYFDYIQFYKKNNDLSPEAKERIRQSLMGAKNSFKEMFIRDYLLWIMLESSASPRLNKIARQILFTYCPFSSEVRQKVQSNPLYGELLRRYDVRCQQQLNRLNKLCQKLRNEGTRVPETIEQEVEYYRK